MWDHVTLAYTNPYNIIGPLSLSQTNPNNDIVRFIIYVSIPSLLLFITYVLFARKLILWKTNIKERKGEKETIPCLSPLVIALCILISLTTPTHHASGPFDSYHEGESIGLATSYMAGKVPYKDYVFSHGVFLDPLRSVIAYKLFGKSIGASRAMMSIVKIVCYILFGILLLTIYGGNATWSLITLLLLFGLLPKQSFILLPREFITFSFLILLSYLGNLKKNSYSLLKISVISFLLAFIPIFSFAISVDRAFYITALYCLLLPVLPLIYFRKQQCRTRYILFSILGLAAGILSLWLLLKGGFAEFLAFVFIYIPQTKELSDGLIFTVSEYRPLAIITVISAMGFWLLSRLLMTFSDKKRYTLLFAVFIKKYFSPIFIFLIAVFCFRSALGRSDVEHIQYSSLLPIFGLLFILIHYYFRNRINRRLFERISTTIVITCCLYSLFLVTKIINNDSLTENFPIAARDSRFIPVEYKETISYLKQNLGEHEMFITLTSEASWYYFLNQPCPTRFPITHFASSQFFQNEVIETLRQKNIRFILYKNSYWANAIDNISNEQRLPLLYSYIHSAYSPHITIDENEIWQKNMR